MRLRARIGLLALLLLAGVLPLAIDPPAEAATAPAASTPAASAPAGTAAVPRPDHVVIVVEENRADSRIVGSPDAPYISGLAAANADFTQSYAETHPSQPNYLALFSGSNNGITDDSCPHTLTGPNLADELTAAGLSFGAYSEDLPSAGYTGCSTAKYVRRHAPWANFPSIPAAAQQPMTAFPTDYSTLPAVSFVIPNLNNDMHDGTIAQGDAWLQAKLGGYVEWAKTHNSLFVLTFDEDDGNENNRIATVLAGQRVTPGSYSERIDHYSVLRTVQDAFGLAPIGNSQGAAPILSVWSPPAGDTLPVSRLTLDCSGQHCAVDGTASTDADGSVVDYAWSFGDGGTAHGATAAHDYAVAGSYPIRLVVTDNAGAATSSTQTVTAAAPSAPFARDTFQRTVTSGLGTADAGGAWTVIGSPGNTSVQPGAAALRVPVGVTTGGYLPSGTRTDADLTLTATPGQAVTGGGLYVSAIGRRVGTSEYRAQLWVAANNSVSLYLSRVSGSAETALAGGYRLPGVVYRPGLALTIRSQVVGTNPTTLRTRAWVAGTAEPTTWPLSTTDTTTALQAAGAVGVIAYLSRSATSPVAVALTDLVARPSTGSADQPPVPAPAVACNGLTCGVDGSGSTDPDGTITAYRWDFGDGATASGASAGHTYASAGTYAVLLSLTDNGGATAARSRLVTVAPAAGQAPVAAFTATPTDLTVAFDGSGSSDADGTVTGYAWTFGDGATSASAKPTHTYAAAGSYDVTLTVIDDQGLSSAPATRSVTVTAPVVTALAIDTFTRTVATGGWGTADTGGAWTLSSGSGQFSVTGTAGRIRMPAGAAPTLALLGSVRPLDSDTSIDCALGGLPNGSGGYVSVLARHNGTSDYRLRVRYTANGQLLLLISKFVSNAETVLRSVTLPVTYRAGEDFRLRFQVSGTAPTTLRASMWRVGTTEPTPQLVTTDATAALQVAGAAGLSTYLSSAATNGPIDVTFDNLSVNR